MAEASENKGGSTRKARRAPGWLNLPVAVALCIGAAIGAASGVGVVWLTSETPAPAAEQAAPERDAPEGAGAADQKDGDAPEGRGAADGGATKPESKEIDAGDEAQDHQHLWVPRYDTVHHDAVYDQVWHDPVYENRTSYHTVCNDCMEVIDGEAREHIEQTGHGGYSTDVPIEDAVMTEAGHYEPVLVEEARDEIVEVGSVCAVCGAEREGGAADES